MKTEGHPALNNVCFLDIGTGKKFLTKSTMKSARTDWGRFKAWLGLGQKS